MTDYFLRDRVQQLTGLTKFSSSNGIATTLTDSAWVTIYSELDTPVHQILKAYNVILGADVTSAVFRIMAAPNSDPGNAYDTPSNKTFPFGDSIEVISAVDNYLDFPLQVPKAHDFFLQVYATGTGANFDATLDYLSIIQSPPLNVV